MYQSTGAYILHSVIIWNIIYHVQIILKNNVWTPRT